MDIEEYVCKSPQELIVNRICKINSSLLDSDDD